MSRKIALFCAFIGAFALLAVPAYAEVQNIKVSGDIQALGVYRSNYDLEDNRNWSETGHTATTNSLYVAEDTDSFLMSVVRLRVDADLTDNVSASVRLANLRDWDLGTNDAGSDINIDLAYITLKEMLYSPLTLIIGRQELNYGNGLIVGYGLFHDPDNSIEYNDLSPLQGYDAVRAILDYDPWTLDIVYAKMEEADDNATQAIPSAQSRDDDVDLAGVNLGYKFDRNDAEMEGYFFYKRDPNYNLLMGDIAGDSAGRTFEKNTLYTLGLRGSVVPTENLTLNAEVAGQWGEIEDEQAHGADTPLTRDREAMMANVAADYVFADKRFTPALGLEYLYTSGEEAANDGDFESWHPVYRGKILGTIRDQLETLYATNDPADSSGWTNQHAVKAGTSLDLGELVDGLSLDLAYLHYWFTEEPVAGADSDIGSEVNMTLTYDYTEDVQFLLDGAWFMPGDYYDELHTVLTMEGGEVAHTANATTGTGRVANDDAISIIGSCKVTF